MQLGIVDILRAKSGRAKFEEVLATEWTGFIGVQVDLRRTRGKVTFKVSRFQSFKVSKVPPDSNKAIFPNLCNFKT